LLGGVPGRVFYHMKRSIIEDRDVFTTAFLNDACNFDVRHRDPRTTADPVT
jgi:hypothetical protein